MLRIYILEDSLPLGRVLAVTLQRAGCDVTLSQSACAILRELEACAYDVLMIDMDMANGESWRALRELSPTINAPPIVVLLSPEHGEPHELEVWGVRVVLLKPVSREALLRGIRLALQDVGRQS